MRKAEKTQKLRRPQEVMEWFWTIRDSQELPFSLDEEDEYARIEPCKNALVQLETGEYVGLQYAYDRNAMALMLGEGESEAVIEQVFRELKLDVGRVMRAENPLWEARSLMRRALLAAERGDGATTITFINQALPILHRSNNGRPDIDAMIVSAETLDRLGAYERAEVLTRAAIKHAEKSEDKTAIERAAPLLNRITKARSAGPPIESGG